METEFKRADIFSSSAIVTDVDLTEIFDMRYGELNGVGSREPPFAKVLIISLPMSTMRP